MACTNKIGKINVIKKQSTNDLITFAATNEKCHKLVELENLKNLISCKIM